MIVQNLKDSIETPAGTAERERAAVPVWDERRQRSKRPRFQQIVPRERHRSRAHEPEARRLGVAERRDRRPGAVGGARLER